MFEITVPRPVPMEVTLSVGFVELAVVAQASFEYAESPAALYALTR